MKKQEKIREAYGECFEEMKPWINTDGWFDKNAFYNKVFSFNYEKIDVLFSHCQDLMIPASIIGIEDNNGWTKIESEDDLPQCQELELYNIKDEKYYRGFLCGNDGRIDFYATHYQSKVNPQPPIY